jgi:iron complex transport system ATP-binding protein
MRLETRELTLAYDGAPVVEDLAIEIPDGKVTSIIGPNGCGKSTLLRALARLMRPRQGAAYLDGQAVHRWATKEVARRLGLLPQSAAVLDAITVEDLVRRGRFPHQSMFSPPSDHDRVAIDRAIALAGVEAIRTRPVDELSGGQRQRAWIGMTLAQETPILLLDEPTTYLDIAHQQEVLDLVRRLNAEEGKTIVMVLHDVNEAARVSDHVIAMRDGAVVAAGPPSEVINPRTIHEVFGLSVDVILDPALGVPHCVPRSRGAGAPVEAAPGAPALRVDGVTLAYERRVVSADLRVAFAAGAVTAIVGPNACGKSTLLRALARLLSPQHGEVYLGETLLPHVGRRELAQSVGLLPQAPVAPAGVTVDDLVGAGRAPHQRWFRQWSSEDERIVSAALDATATAALRDREVDTLSGGQRQRAWLGMSLARQAPLLLLDEPTTYLDIAHQVEFLDLVVRLNRDHGTTVIMVLHDLSMACRYADHMVVMKDGEVAAAGHPRDIVTADLVRAVFEVDAAVVIDEATGRPLVLPRPAAPVSR